MATYLFTLLAGAASTLVATSVVQLHVVPRVEGRKRREDRWERDVRALGELLAFEFADVALELYRAIILEVFTSASRDDLNPAECEAMRSEQADRLRTALQEFDRVCERITWLADEISSISRGGGAVRRSFGDAMWGFMRARMTIHEAVNGDEVQLLLADAKGATTEMEAASVVLRAAVRRLSMGGPPIPPGLLRRFGRRVKVVVAGPWRVWSRWRAQREEDALMAWAERVLAFEEGLDVAS